MHLGDFCLCYFPNLNSVSFVFHTQVLNSATKTSLLSAERNNPGWTKAHVDEKKCSVGIMVWDKYQKLDHGGCHSNLPFVFVRDSWKENLWPWAPKAFAASMFSEKLKACCPRQNQGVRFDPFLIVIFVLKYFAQTVPFGKNKNSCAKSVQSAGFPYFTRCNFLSQILKWLLCWAITQRNVRFQLKIYQTHMSARNPISDEEDEK